MNITKFSTETPPCDHCGEPCPSSGEIRLEDKLFCCEGCKMVYEILHQNDLCQYYNIEEKAGIKVKGKLDSGKYAFLDEPTIVRQIIDFEDEAVVKVTFQIPQMHCSACIWLLENLYRLNDAISQSKVNFLKKEAYITYRKDQTTLRQVVNLLASIGYEPSIHLATLNTKKVVTQPHRRFYYQIGLAGFTFGNVMLMSFPEYLGLNSELEGSFATFFGYGNLLLSLPVTFYSGQDYFRSAWAGLRQRNLNIDIPISLGILALFSRSVYEVVSQTGAGYFDSLTGLIFFLLIGKWFQRTTYSIISFDRDYKSYFPIAANRLQGGAEVSVALTQLSAGDRIVIRNEELVPADGILITGTANIDYSFVTGESALVTKNVGSLLYAGGRQSGQSITVELTKTVSQSYLTQLWNNEAFEKGKVSKMAILIDRIGSSFTIFVLSMALLTGIYWAFKDSSVVLHAVTSVLIIACPCAISLAVPFTLGNSIRWMGKSGLFVKNTSVVERLANIRKIVFDKTGTLTDTSHSNLRWEGLGEPLNEDGWSVVAALVRQSDHPKSKRIAHWIAAESGLTVQNNVVLNEVEEVIGQGMVGSTKDVEAAVGSWRLVGNTAEGAEGTFVAINGEVRGRFLIESNFREGLQLLIERLRPQYGLHLLSGDNERERGRFASIFHNAKMLFHQSPSDKLAYIQSLQHDGLVMMVGDGLNDAGALQQSDVGIAVSENINRFSPACDGILEAGRLQHLDTFIRFAKGSVRLVHYAFAVSFVYNVIGLYFAVQGLLEPVIAAILMPVSSITVVAFGTVATNILSKTVGIRQHEGKREATK